MARNVLEARVADVRRLSQEFQVLLDHYGRNSVTERQQLEYINIFEQALYDITVSFSRSNFGCPKGYTDCPSGGCMPRGRVCPDG